MSGHHKLPVQCERGQGQTHPRVLPDLKSKDTETALHASLFGPAAVVCERVVNSYREESPPRSSPYEADTVALKDNWRVPESLEKVIVIPKLLQPHLKW